MATEELQRMMQAMMAQNEQLNRTVGELSAQEATQQQQLNAQQQMGAVF